MSWRVVVVQDRCKLEYKMNYLIVRGETTKRIHMSEIGTILVETPACALTGVVLTECCKRKINLIFCDEKHNPISQMIPFYGSHDSSRKLQQQITWTEAMKNNVWTQIIAQKIQQQMIFLRELGFSQWEKLQYYLQELQVGDPSNREGHAAKVYFDTLFGVKFSREQECVINDALNYGYTIILSAVNRAIVSQGYVTQLGLKHTNVFNQFNLASDLMEPFRVLIDRYVVGQANTIFDQKYRYELVNILNQEIILQGQNQTLSHAINIFVKNVLDGLSEHRKDCVLMYVVKKRSYEV